MKRAFIRFIVCALLIGGVVGWYEVSHLRRQRADEAKKAAGESSQRQLAELKTRVEAIANEHDAVVGWEDALYRSSGEGLKLYSADVQRTLLAKGKPILFIGAPADIRSVEGKTIVRFAADTKDMFYGDSFVFEVECGEEAVTAIHHSDFLDYFAVVASIASVDTNYSEVTVGGELEGRREIVARGRCLALTPVDLDYVIAQDKSTEKRGSK